MNAIARRFRSNVASVRYSGEILLIRCSSQIRWIVIRGPMYGYCAKPRVKIPDRKTTLFPGVIFELLLCRERSENR